MSRFHANCSRCCGICCIVPAQMKVQGFAHDKPAGHPCRHLSEHHQCHIYADRLEHGFGACIGFDCHGTGQWITALVGNTRWGVSSAGDRELAEAWHYWLPRFSAAAMLDVARKYMPVEQQEILQKHIDELLRPGSRQEPHQDSAARINRDATALIRRLWASRSSPAPDLLP